MEYIIFHIDMDSFFASIEENKNIKFKNKPLVVGGRGKRGVVSSANYVARELGIKSAMPISKALKIYPKLIIADAHFEDYSYYSFAIYSFLKTITKLVEIGSIDEWYISLKNTKYESWTEEEFAYYIKEYIYKHWKLKCTIGCSWNKFLAKMATNLSKPNGFGILNKNNFKDKIYNLDISKMYSVGKTTSNTLKELGINVIGDIVKKQYNENEIQKKIGSHWITIKGNALGFGSQKIETSADPKSIGRSHSIIEYYDFNEYKKLFYNITNSLNKNLIEGNYSFNNITLKIKYISNDIDTINIKNNTNQKYLNENKRIFEFDKNIPNTKYNQIKNISVSLWPIKRNIFTQEQMNMFNDNYNEIDSIIVNVNNSLSSKAIFKASELKKHYYKPSK